MGQKIATEEDYWMCSSGIMPARMQSIQPVVKQKDGKRYLLQTDTATASAGDFVCKWMMLLMAAIAAIVAVVVVATGGAALGAIVAAGAIAGAAGAAGGAILGGLVCGQKAAMLRVWKVEKSNLLIGGQKTLTSASYMTCPVFSSEIKRAPNIKNWWQALLVGMGNFGTTVVEGALGGAMIGTVGALLAGAATLALPTIGSVLTNVGASFTGLGLAVRGVFGVNAASNEWASGDVNNMGDAAKSFAGGAVPEAGSIKRIATGQAQPSDALLLLYFLHLKTPVQEPHSQPEEKEGKPKDEEVNNSAKPENEPEPTKPGEDGKGYELGEEKDADSAKLNGDTPARIEYKGFGGDIICDPNKTTTVIGKFTDEVNGAGTKEILNLPDGSFTRGGQNLNGVNILDIPSDKYEGLLNDYGPDLGKEMFWDQYNEPFLESAFKSGDNVRLLSDPTAPANRTGFYSRELNAVEGYTDANGNQVAGLAEKYGYVYDPSTSTYTKP